MAFLPRALPVSMLEPKVLFYVLESASHLRRLCFAEVESETLSWPLLGRSLPSKVCG